MPSGTAITLATTPIPATQHTAITIVCLGVMPTALNTPRSCTRSLVCSTIVFSTPSPATIASSKVSVPIRVIIRSTTSEAWLLSMTK